MEILMPYPAPELLGVPLCHPLACTDAKLAVDPNLPAVIDPTVGSLPKGLP